MDLIDKSNIKFNDNISFSPDKSETDKYTTYSTYSINIDDKINDTQKKPIKHLSIYDFNNFEAIKKALESCTTQEEQIKLSYVVPLVLDTTTQRYVLSPFAEKIYNNTKQTYPFSVNVYIPPTCDPYKYTESPLGTWWKEYQNNLTE